MNQATSPCHLRQNTMLQFLNQFLHAEELREESYAKGTERNEYDCSFTNPCYACRNFSPGSFARSLKGKGPRKGKQKGKEAMHEETAKGKGKNKGKSNLPFIYRKGDCLLELEKTEKEDIKICVPTEEKNIPCFPCYCYYNNKLDEAKTRGSN